MAQSSVASKLRRSRAHRIANLLPSRQPARFARSLRDSAHLTLRLRLPWSVKFATTRYIAMVNLLLEPRPALLG
jgi:hypothetical protein